MHGAPESNGPERMNSAVHTASLGDKKKKRAPPHGCWPARGRVSGFRGQATTAQPAAMPSNGLPMTVTVRRR